MKVSNSLTPVVLIPWLLIDVKSEGHVAFASKNVSSSKGLGIATGAQDESLMDLSSNGPQNERVVLDFVTMMCVAGGREARWLKGDLEISFFISSRA